MNILLTLNNKFTNYALVMLTSLFYNHPGVKFHINIVHTDLNVASRALLQDFISKNNSETKFICIDADMYKFYPTTEALTCECYFILMAHLLLPNDMDRILYLDADLYVDGNLSQLYQMDFENNYLIAAGQQAVAENGCYFPKNAKPEKGECFNSGVLVFNLPKFRNDITFEAYQKAAKEKKYQFELADQGILNLMFWDKTKYVPTLDYNFRISVWKENRHAIKRKHLNYVNPRIVHFAMHDFFGIGISTKPWTLTLSEKELELLCGLGLSKLDKLAQPELGNIVTAIHQKWWEYAQRSPVYCQLRKEMINSKCHLLSQMIKTYAKDRTNVFFLMDKWDEMRKSKQVDQQIERVWRGNAYSDQILTQITYGELEKFIDNLNHGEAIACINRIFEKSIRRLRAKKIIRVVFLVYSSAEWQCEELYWMFEKSGGYKPYIVICGYQQGDGRMIEQTYNKTYQYFNRSKYRVLYADINDTKGNIDMLKPFDLLFCSTPFTSLMPYYFNVHFRTLNQLILYVPYGIYIEKKPKSIYGDDYYNKPMFKLCWKYYTESMGQYITAKRLHELNGYNFLYSGLPKMDVFYHKQKYNPISIWKCSERTKSRIIYAPHFNMKLNSTFNENYQWFYEFAEKNQEISWIVRPHPRLAYGAVEAGVFKNLDEYNAYMERWNQLPNSKVVEGGEYADIFLTSDAMIVDSLSFLSEYQYTGKPLLCLLPKVPRPLDSLGNELLSHLYTARGNDFNGIENFIADVVMDGRDHLKKEREKFFKCNLDYYFLTGRLASETIFNDIEQAIFGNRLVGISMEEE